MITFGSTTTAIEKLFLFLGRVTLMLMGSVMLSGGAAADNVTYTLVISSPFGESATFGPSGKLGDISFGGSSNDAVLTFTFVGDTNNVIPFSVSGTLGYEILLGTSSILVTDAKTGTVITQGTFLPSAGVFVSVDNTHSSAGFGSFGLPPSSPNFPNAIQPVYPYGVQFGVGLNTYDLKSNFSLGAGTSSYENSGISCVNFPECNALSIPLALSTTAGNLYVDPAPSDATHGFYENSSFTALVGSNTQVPEPSSVVLLCTGILAFAPLHWLIGFPRSPTRVRHSGA